MPVLAIGGVDIFIFVVALAAVLVLGGMWVFAIVIGKMLSPLPLVGHFVEDTVARSLLGAMQAVLGEFDTVTHAVAHFFWAIATAPWHLLNALNQAISAAMNTAVNALGFAQQVAVGVGAQVAAGVADAENFALQAEANAQRYAERIGAETLATAEAYASAVGADVLHDAETIYNDAVAYAAAGDAAVTAIAQSLADQVYNDAARFFDEAVASADAGVAAAEALAQSLADQVYNDAARLFDEATADSEAFAESAIAGALASVLPRVATLEAEADECLKPLCDTVTPNAGALGRLGSLLQGLETLGIDTLFIALAAEAVTDPAAVATDFQTVVSDVGDPILAGFRDLIGA